ncbi:FHA domain-containing protein [Pseudokineococcus marinus]|uniref:FHA domain-containing protein n=1 Tax=Pseudokineococcus marinus TaxID=351215 RepID=A0A849BHF1_9ACTN|nr:FHA domain-containing protein [Pseudokineococcus marinus]NNH22559.1 FHA domain-containing protein [Pseudokineococcus marinus]
MSTQDEGARDAREEAPRGSGPADTTSSHALPDVEAAARGAGRDDEAQAEDAASPLSTDEQSAVAALPPGSALLVVQRGPNQGARFLLDAVRTTAGRNPQSDIFLDDVTVSRRHAELVRDGTGAGARFRVRDAGSLNGTYVNRVRVDEVELSAGDEVQVGKYRLVFHPSATGPEGEGA